MTFSSHISPLQYDVLYHGMDRFDAALRNHDKPQFNSWSLAVDAPHPMNEDLRQKLRKGLIEASTDFGIAHAIGTPYTIVTAELSSKKKETYIVVPGIFHKETPAILLFQQDAKKPDCYHYLTFQHTRGRKIAGFAFTT